MENKYPTEERWYDLYELVIHQHFKVYPKHQNLLSIYNNTKHIVSFFEDCQKYEVKFPIKNLRMDFNNNYFDIDFEIKYDWSLNPVYCDEDHERFEYQKPGIKESIFRSYYDAEGELKIKSLIRLKKVYMLDILGEEAKELKDAPYAIVKSLYDTFTKEEEKE